MEKPYDVGYLSETEFRDSSDERDITSSYMDSNPWFNNRTALESNDKVVHSQNTSKLVLFLESDVLDVVPNPNN